MHDLPDTAKPTTPLPRRRWTRWLLWTFSLLVLALAGLLGGAWWWSGQADSLNRTLQYVAQWLPADQKLEARGVQGTLRHGGHIDWLRWSNPNTQVEVTQTAIDWRLQPLLSRALHFGQVHIEQLRIQSTPAPDDDTATEPLQALPLPVRIDLPLRIDEFVWSGTPDIRITALDAHYRYTGTQHELDLHSLHYAEGVYQAQARLQAAAPMDLTATLQGKLDTTLPTAEATPLHLDAHVQITGQLATEAARLHIQAQAHTTTDAADATPASADISATIAPWSPHLLEQAQAQLKHLNVAWFLPEGPQTDLNGHVQAGPQDQGWALEVQLNNPLSGPWDQQALPVRSLSAQAHFDGSQHWTLEQARIDLGAEGNAHIQAQGRLNTATQVFEGQADFVDISPATLYSTLDSAPLSGQLQAQGDDTQTVQFKLDVRAPAARKVHALHLGAIRTEGSWQAPQLQLRNLYLNALQATLQSPSLRIDTDSTHIEGTLQAQLPGAQAQLNMAGSPTAGQGRVELNVKAFQDLSHWLTQLPGMQDLLAGASVQGQANAQLQWYGGWGPLLQRLQNPATPIAPSHLRLNAQLQVPQLRYQDHSGSTTELLRTKLTLTGSPEALQADLHAQAHIAHQTVELDTEATLGLQTGKQVHAMDWYARITQLVAQWRAPSDSTPWKAQLTEPFTVQQNTTGSPVQTVRMQATASGISIQPPAHAVNKTASITWEPLQLQHSGSQWAIQSKGRLSGLPLVWMDTLNPDHPPLAAIGISGDLSLQGHWDIDTSSRSPRTEIRLERADGDIRFAVEDSNAANVTIIRSSGASERNANTNQVQSRVIRSGVGVRANIQQMYVQLNTQGNEVHTQLLWTTKNAGQISADVRSQIQITPQGIDWPDTAPLSGEIDASLPNIGVWAFFAPPGWRATGSFFADLSLSGTRKAPNWTGEIKADQLSLQSLLDGVDLKDGRLRARIQGTRLDITELYLQGGQGSTTRILGPSGNLTAAPQEGGTLTGSGVIEYDPMAPEDQSGLRMDLKAVANHLQVLVRADRQLSVSGTLGANLTNGQFRLNGDLSIDRAAIILADDSAPSLGDDVHITSAAIRQDAQAKAAQDAARASGSVQASKPPLIDVKLNLGNDFALQGYGITTRLRGALTITGGPRITGEIHTVNGRYRAWGQLLDVETGTIRFNGPYANPAIDIVAIRPNIDVRAGIKVTGSANNPRITLFSEPDMSDAEKLSWIVMGRAASGGGAETALLQQAALAMLSGGGNTGNFASQLGFDEIGFKGPSDDGESGAALTIGKRLSKDLYITYEQSLNGAMGTLYIFYDLSRRLTLRGQTGEQSAVDLIYTRAKD